MWEILAAVKTEFSKFGAALESVRKKLHTASNEIDQVGTRTRVMQRTLRGVEEASEDSARSLFGPTDQEP